EKFAGWFGASVAAAFFALLDQCSCVNVGTDGKDEEEEVHDWPLMLTDLGSVHMSSFNSNSGIDNFVDVSKYPPSVEKLPCLIADLYSSSLCGQ
ncbi:hypothetical protein PHJA_001717700, partial [Phtheirospermum japonicum]